jgi:hypothetical protein
MPKTTPRSESIVLSVEICPRIGLHGADRSLGLLRGGIATLNALAHVAALQTEREGSTVEIDWAGIEYLTEALEGELGNGTFDSLEMAVSEALVAEREAREGGAR